MNEIKKLEEKIKLYQNNKHSFFWDSLNGEVINPEFKLIDFGFQLPLRTTRTDNLINNFFSGNKITLRG